MQKNILMIIGGYILLITGVLAFDQNEMKIFAGFYNTCVAKGDQLKCVGIDGYSKINVPNDFKGLKQVAIGRRLICALDNDGAWCWGDSVDTVLSTELGNLPKVESIVVGYDHLCLLLEQSKSVKCFSDNGNQIEVPKDLNKVVSIAAGEEHTCAIEQSGRVKCWGGDNRFDQLKVPNDLDKVVMIKTKGSHTCALEQSGKVKCWGYNEFNQTTVPKNLDKVISIEPGYNHTCALEQSGKVKCWGDDKNMQSSIPKTLNNVMNLTSGILHTCALEQSGEVKCWGNNSYGELSLADL